MVAAGARPSRAIAPLKSHAANGRTRHNPHGRPLNPVRPLHSAGKPTARPHAAHGEAAGSPQRGRRQATARPQAGPQQSSRHAHSEAARKPTAGLQGGPRRGRREAHGGAAGRPTARPQGGHGESSPRKRLSSEALSKEALVKRSPLQ